MKNSYENDAQSSLKYCRMLLKTIGVWPLINGYTSRLEKFVSIMLMITWLTTSSFVVLPAEYYCFFYLKELDVKIKTFGPVSFCFSCILKYCYFNLRTPAFKHCINQMERDWKFMENSEHRAIMIDNVIMAQKFTIVITFVLCVFGVAYCTILPIWTDTFQIVGNFSTKPLVFPGLQLFLDVYATPTYQFVYIMHCIYVFFCVSIETTLCGIVASFVAHACGMLQIQIARLKYLIVEKEVKHDGSLNLLAVVVKGHVNVLKYTKSISNALQEICFLGVVSSIVGICATEYLCVVEWKNRDMVATATYGGILISLSINMLMICYVGELLVEKGEKFGDAIYNIQWYNLSGKSGRDLILLIAISKYPPKLTGGKIFDVSINTFANVLRTSLVYLNFFQTITEW